MLDHKVMMELFDMKQRWFDQTFKRGSPFLHPFLDSQHRFSSRLAYVDWIRWAISPDSHIIVRMAVNWNSMHLIIAAFDIGDECGQGLGLMLPSHAAMGKDHVLVPTGWLHCTSHTIVLHGIQFPLSRLRTILHNCQTVNVLAFFIATELRGTTREWRVLGMSSHYRRDSLDWLAHESSRKPYIRV